MSDDPLEIVVGYDGSGCADAALDVALEFAAALGDHIVLVFGAAPGGYGGGEVPAQRDAVEEHARKELERGRAHAERRGVDVDVELVGRKPSAALHEVASKRSARMIVIGSHSETPLRAAVIGSTPAKLLEISDVPVLVVPLED